jgi:hypothetical protein
MESFYGPTIFGSQGLLIMNTYVKRLLIVMSISSMYLSYAADAAYHIAHLDPVRITSKQQFFDKKYMRSKYLRYAGMSAVAAWMVYSGYKYVTKMPATPSSSISNDQTGLTRKVETLQQEVDHLKQNMELVKGNNWLAWGSDLMHHAIWGIELSTLLKIGVALASAPSIVRFFGPLLDVDELRHELRGDVDFMKAIVSKVRFLAREDRQETDREYLCRMTQDTFILLKKQIESMIGFVRHKQEQYQDEHPALAAQVDDQIHYLTASFNHLADTMGALLNSEATSFERLCQEIIDHAQRFGQEYAGVKDQLKALEDRLYEEADGAV